MNIADTIETFNRRIAFSRAEVMGEFDDPKIVEEKLSYVTIEVQPRVFMRFYFGYKGLNSRYVDETMNVDDIETDDLYFAKIYVETKQGFIDLFERKVSNATPRR